LNSRAIFGNLKDAAALIAPTQWPRINLNAVAGPSKPPFRPVSYFQRSPSSNLFHDVPTKKTSLPNLSSIHTSSGSISKHKAPIKHLKVREYSAGNSDSAPGYDSASSPYASASPPPETPMLPTKVLRMFKDKVKPSGLSNLFQDRMRRPYSTFIFIIPASLVRLQIVEVLPILEARHPSPRRTN
jgi:hypothetical protein